MKKRIKNICCIGAGYVGGPTMSVIADKCPNLIVNVVDIDSSRIEAWNSKDITDLPIYEPGLSKIVKRCRGKNLFFSSNIQKHLSNADMVFISVNTPTKTTGKGAGKASDLKWVEASTRQISKYAKGHTIVVEKSTLPVRTAETIKRILHSEENENNQLRNTKTFAILSNPEFLSEGTAINDLEDPDRILIGGEDEDAMNELEKIYLNWVKKEKIIRTNLWSSELSKLVANAFLAQRISSINSVSALCEVTGADVNDISLAIGFDKRIGKLFLNSGPGFGGSCFKKDILNLVYICDQYGLHEVSKYWNEVLKINTWQQKRISSIIVENLFGTITDKEITVFGLAFKANTNDTRESPAIKICEELIDEGAFLKIYDPKVKELQVDKLLPQNKNNKVNWKYYSNLLEACHNSHAIIVLTEWVEFNNLNWVAIKNVMKRPPWVFDTRNIIDVQKAKNSGFQTWILGNSNDMN